MPSFWTIGASKKAPNFPPNFSPLQHHKATAGSTWAATSKTSNSLPQVSQRTSSMTTQEVSSSGGGRGTCFSSIHASSAALILKSSTKHVAGLRSSESNHLNTQRKTKHPGSNSKAHNKDHQNYSQKPLRVF